MQSNLISKLTTDVQYMVENDIFNDCTMNTEDIFDKLNNIKKKLGASEQKNHLYLLNKKQLISSISNDIFIKQHKQEKYIADIKHDDIKKGKYTLPMIKNGMDTETLLILPKLINKINNNYLFNISLI